MTSAPDLPTLLAKARAEPRATRLVTYRDAVADHGAAAIEQIAPWIADPELGAFAVRVIEKVAAQGHKPAAVAALTRSRLTAASSDIVGDIDWALGRLGHKEATPKSPGDPYAVATIPADAGVGWPGFQEHEFGKVAGTRWRSRDGHASLAPLIVTALRYRHPHVESYPVERSPELHFAIRERYRQRGGQYQGWRASKLVVYAHGPRESDPPGTPSIVTTGLYIEKGDGAPPYGPVDDLWDWPWFLRALRAEHARDELTRAMVRHDLRVGTYIGGRSGVDGEGVGFVGSMVEGELLLVDRNGSEVGRGWDRLVEILEGLPAAVWHDLHIWRSWPADEAIAAGHAFATLEILPVLDSMMDLYLDIVTEPLARLESR